MAEETTPTEVHPGSFVGDTIEEFKKMPTWGKVALGLVVVGIIIFVIWQKQNAGPNITGTQPIPGGIPQGGIPVYDPNGNLIGYSLGPGGGTPSPTPTPTPPPPSPPTTAVPPGNHPGGGKPPFKFPDILKKMEIMFSGGSYSYAKDNPGGGGDSSGKDLSGLFPHGTIFSTLPNGDLGYQLPGGKVIDSGIKVDVEGGSGNSGSNNAPLHPNIQQQHQVQQHSSQPQNPRLGSHVVQPGESMQKIAAVHNVPLGTLQAANPQQIRPGTRLIVPRGGK